MNSNKKMLNPKKLRPLLLCPSKRYPGKLYCFNVSTGEAAWCISKTDKKIKKALINRVTDKSHSYPEPSQAPIGNSANKTKSFISQKNDGITEFQNANVFGETVFPEYVPPDDSTPNYGRTLTPMYRQSQHRPSNVFQFQKQPFQCEDLPAFDQTANFSSFKLSKESHTLAKPFMKDEASQTFLLRFQSEGDSTAKSALKGSRSAVNISTLFTKDVETSTISRPQEVDNETGTPSELDKNDLGFKLVETEKAGKSTAQSTSKTREVLTPQKRVTFDIQDSEASNAITQELQQTDQNPETSRAEELKQPTPDGVWYVVADTAVLLEDLQWVEKFVKSDALCRLLIPRAVYTELEQRSCGDSLKFRARRLLRKLADENSHIIVQSISDDELSLEDSLLECCWTLLQEDCHVVLISNNTKLLNEAKSIDLKCYTIDEIKNHNKADAGHKTVNKEPNISTTTTVENPEYGKPYLLIKVFLAKAKRLLLVSHEFMTQSMRQYKKGMPAHVLNDIQLKCLRGREHIQKVAENLRSILVRESSTERTVKNILIETGEYKEDDPVVNNYTETVAILLKNMELVDEALGSMLRLKCNSVKEKKESCSGSQDTSHTKGGKMYGNKS